MVEYFIAYDYLKDGSRGKGNGHVYLDNPINKMEKITEIELKYSSEKGYEKMVITNFIRLN